MQKRDFLILLVVFLLTFLLRFPFISVPTLDADESVYINVANNFMDGGMPYKDAWDHKPPVLYFLFYFAFKLFGKSVESIHIFTIFYIILTSFLIYFLTKRLWGFYSGAFAGIAYSVFSASPMIGGLASNAELFMNLPIVAAIYIFILAIEEKKDDRKNFLFLLAGVLIGLGTLIKQTAIVVLIPIFILIFFTYYGTKKKLYNILLIMLGFLAPIISIIFYFKLNDALPDFIFANVWYNMEYTGTINDILEMPGNIFWYDVEYKGGLNLIELFYGFINKTGIIVNEFFLLFYLAIASIVLFAIKAGKSKIKQRRIPHKNKTKRSKSKTKPSCDSKNHSFNLSDIYTTSETKLSCDNKIASLIILWLISSALGVFLGTNFFGHYYIQLLPSLSILAGYSIKELSDSVRSIGFNRLKLIIFLVLIIVSVYGFANPVKQNLKDTRYMLSDYNDSVVDTSKKYAKNVSNDSLVYFNITRDDERIFLISEYIKLNSNKSDYIFIWKEHPIIYFLSERKPATKYVTWMHVNNWNPNSQVYTMKQIIEKKPKYIVLQKGDTSMWITTILFEDFLYQFIQKNYTLKLIINDQVFVYKYVQT